MPRPAPFHDDRDGAIDALPLAAPAAMAIPCVDLCAPDAMAAIAAACRDWGLFQLVGHGVDPALTENCLAAMQRFFALPLAEKQRLSRSLENPWGFYDRELTKNRQDSKQIFDIGPDAAGERDPAGGETPWPATDPHFTQTMQRTMATFEDLAARITALIFAGLGEKPDSVAASFRPAPTSFFRLNYYPLNHAPGARSVHHHSDSGALTVLLTDGTAGLEVLHGACWHPVHHLPGALVINIGDMIEVWSNGLYGAPIHRVAAMTQAERYSAPFFYNPAWHAEVAPLPGAIGKGEARFRPVPWSEFRSLRAQGDYGDYGREVQIADYLL